MPVNAARSISSVSSRSDQAAQLCPPARTATRSPSAAASRTPAATSATSAARSTAAGRRGGRRWLKIRLTAASSNPASPGRSSRPVNEQGISVTFRSASVAAIGREARNRRDQLDEVAVRVGDVGHPHARLRRVARIPDRARAVVDRAARRPASRSATWKHTWLKPWTALADGGSVLGTPGTEPASSISSTPVSPSPSANPPRSFERRHLELVTGPQAERRAVPGERAVQVRNADPGVVHSHRAVLMSFSARSGCGGRRPLAAVDRPRAGGGAGQDAGGGGEAAWAAIEDGVIRNGCGLIRGHAAFSPGRRGRPWRGSARRRRPGRRPR